jgi:hypothetical protein
MSQREHFRLNRRVRSSFEQALCRWRVIGEDSRTDREAVAESIETLAVGDGPADGAEQQLRCHRWRWLALAHQFREKLDREEQDRLAQFKASLRRTFRVRLPETPDRWRPEHRGRHR